MSSKKAKAKVSQSDLRKMMQQMKTKRGTNETANGSLVHAKSSQKRPHSSEVSAHTNATDIKKAKLAAKLQRDMERIIAAKSGKPITTPKDNGNVVGKKRTLQETAPQGVMAPPKAKLVKISPSRKPKPTQSSSALLSSAYSDSDSSEDEQQTVLLPSSASSNGKGEGSSSSSAKPDASGAKKTDDSQSLPEGFFDDPERDAKMRGVETPADKMDREWESFQRQLQREEDQSEQIIEEEQETGHLDREIEEIDEQIKLYNLVDKLADKKDSVIEVIKSVKPKFKKQEEDSSSEMEDDEDLLDWREKDAFT